MNAEEAKEKQIELPKSCIVMEQVATAVIHRVADTAVDVVGLHRIQDGGEGHLGIVEADRADVQHTSDSSVAVLILLALHADARAC